MSLFSDDLTVLEAACYHYRSVKFSNTTVDNYMRQMTAVDFTYGPFIRRNATFTRLLAAALHRPALLPVPGFALKLALGGFGGALLDSQRALPQALTSDGFRFKYPDLEAALQNLETTGKPSGT